MIISLGLFGKDGSQKVIVAIQQAIKLNFKESVQNIYNYFRSSLSDDSKGISYNQMVQGLNQDMWKENANSKVFAQELLDEYAYDDDFYLTESELAYLLAKESPKLMINDVLKKNGTVVPACKHCLGEIIHALGDLFKQIDHNDGEINAQEIDNELKQLKVQNYSTIDVNNFIINAQQKPGSYVLDYDTFLQSVLLGFYELHYIEKRKPLKELIEETKKGLRRVKVQKMLPQLIEQTKQMLIPKKTNKSIHEQIQETKTLLSQFVKNSDSNTQNVTTKKQNTEEHLISEYKQDMKQSIPELIKETTKLLLKPS